MINRHTKILELLAQRQQIKVTDLADMLDVSQVTVRKDLDVLEERGLIRRIHGYASLDGADDVGKRMAYNYAIKRRIAKAAAATVEEGETVMIESGSCCAFLAEELVQSKKDVTIVTNSAFIANFIRHAPNVKIILLGGYYQPDSQVMVGPMTSKCGEIFFSDKFFVGVDGFMPKFGFTGKDHLRVQTVTDLAERAREVIVLTEAEKFNRQGVLGMVRFDSIANVYTDEGIPSEAEAALQDNNVAIHKVPQYDSENTQ
ncbi:MAG: DeoR/GlpR family DNA-binding transcription regulator [Treponema sp.]|jgi:DeoR/GlpR family transcriptional regulator of sugar metabolism|nr:DeoR/GlpR family DNA-binding transcription regulator [Treponema sp.]